jgi:hypothetical protein
MRWITVAGLWFQNSQPSVKNGTGGVKNNYLSKGAVFP